MVSESNPPHLDYETHVGFRRSSAIRWFALCAGVLVGEVFSGFQLAVLRLGGPIFPMTVLYSPAHVLVEWTGDDRVLLLALFGIGPLLLGTYALLAVSQKRGLTLPLAIGVHLVCFYVTLVQRGVVSPIGLWFAFARLVESSFGA